MKNKYFLFFLIIICMAVCSCADNANGNKPRKKEQQEAVLPDEGSKKQGGFYGDAIFLTTLGLMDSGDYETVAAQNEWREDSKSLDVISSWEDWLMFLREVGKEDYQKLDYSDQFFEENDLLVVRFYTDRELRYKYSFEKMGYVDGQLVITVGEKFPQDLEGVLIEQELSGLPDSSSNMMGLLIKVDKESVPGGVQWELLRENGVYSWEKGCIRDVRQSEDGLTMEFDEMEWIADEAQPDGTCLVSKGEPAKTYAIDEQVQCVVGTAGMERYNKDHKEALKGVALDYGGFQVKTDEFMKYLEYINSVDDRKKTIFGITVEDGKVVEMQESYVQGISDSK